MYSSWYMDIKHLLHELFLKPSFSSKWNICGWILQPGIYEPLEGGMARKWELPKKAFCVCKILCGKGIGVDCTYSASMPCECVVRNVVNSLSTCHQQEFKMETYYCFLSKALCHLNHLHLTLLYIIYVAKQL